MSRQTGEEHRYDVTRRDDPEGKHAACFFFVLDIEHDPLARIALRAYATAAADEGYLPLASALEARLAMNAQRLMQEDL